MGRTSDLSSRLDRPCSMVCVMGAAESGNARALKARGLADDLEDQARDLLARADRARARAAAIEKGNDGERAIGELLDQLAHEGWTVLHDRRKSSSSPANLDHIAIGPGGVFVIDSKNWSGGHVRLDERGMAVGRWRKDDELHSVTVDADVVGRVVATVNPGLRTLGVVAFVQNMGLTSTVFHRGVLVTQREHLLAALRSVTPVMTPDQTSTLAARIDAHFPPRASAERRAPRPPAPSVTGVRRQRDPASAWRPSPSRPPRQRTRHHHEQLSARRQLLKVAAVLVCLPALPWFLQHVVTPVTQQVVQQVVVPAPDDSRPRG